MQRLGGRGGSSSVEDRVGNVRRRRRDHVLPVVAGFRRGGGVHVKSLRRLSADRLPELGAARLAGIVASLAGDGALLVVMLLVSLRGALPRIDVLSVHVVPSARSFLLVFLDLSRLSDALRSRLPLARYVLLIQSGQRLSRVNESCFK